MTNHEQDAEVTATARQITKNINTQARITLELSATGQKIENCLDNPEATHAGLDDLAIDAAAAARLTTETCYRIRYLAYQLRSLLDGEEVEND